MQQQQVLSDLAGLPIATIDITTILKGDGGFGGTPFTPARIELPHDRAPDATLEVAAPRDDDHAMFRLSKEIAVAASLPPGQSMMRGVGCFGLAGRAVLELVCGGQTERLKRLSVRYAGPMLTGETMAIEMWHVGPGRAMFRMKARERDALVVNNCLVEFAT